MLKTFSDFGIDVPHNAHGEIDTTCPECSHTRKKKRARCLSVNIDKGVWHCAHCGWAGGLSEGAKRTDVIHWRKPKYRKPEPQPLTDLPRQVVEWFGKRGISEGTLKRNRVGYGKVYMPQAEDHVTAISFPYFRTDELINVKWRDGQKNFRMEAGAERILYGLSDIAETTIIVEGEIDKLSLEEVGFINCVSVPDGAPTPNTKDYSSKFDFLEADKERLEAVKEWIIAVDDDEPGKRLEDELSRRLGREKCKRVIWPQGCKDANEVLIQNGAQVVIECIMNAQPYPLAGVFEVLDVSDRIDHLYEHGWEKGVSTGWESLDKHYTVRPGEFTVVTGIPNSGKSNWLDALIMNLARNHGWHFGIFSPENQPLEDHMARMIEKWGGMPFSDGPTQRIDRKSLGFAKEFLQEHFSWILPDDDIDWTLDAILDSARALVFRKGIRGLVIDPWNEIEHMRPMSMSETEYISRSLKRIRTFGRRYGVHVWVVAHPAKLYRDSNGKYPVPTLYDISGSAHWRNKADNGVCVWRDFSDQRNRAVEIHVQKVRFRQIGKIGFAQLAYNHVTATYHELSRANDEIPAEYGVPI